MLPVAPGWGLGGFGAAVPKLTTMTPMRAIRLTAALALAAGPLAVIGAAPASASVTVSVSTYQFKTSYPTSTGLTRQCNVVGDLYVPSDASPAHREPAILTTNGFGGSKADQATLAKELGARGYITLSYSGLGFGGSGCPITDDDPTSDGAVAKQLVSFLGGAGGIAYTGFSAVGGWTGPVAPLQVVQRDACDHVGRCGASNVNDPRVGMVGESYGGEIQFAAAGVDPRIDTIIPLITWHDLTYSLSPGNSSLPGDSLAPGQPGVGKTEWDNFFFGLGVAAVAGGSTSSAGNPQALGEPQPASAQTFGATDAQCPGFQPETCTAEAQESQTGTADATAKAFFTHSSVTSYLDRIHIPVFFGQGEHDTLFNLQEAAATFTALKGRGIPVKMDWQSWGHSQLGAAPGEFPYASEDPSTTYAQTYQGGQIEQWFDYYLKGSGPAPALDFSFFRDWAYQGSGTAGAANKAAATAAYGHAATFPFATTQRYNLSGTNALVPVGSVVTTGGASITAVPGGHSSYSNTDAAGVVTSYSNPLSQPAPSDLAGTYAGWTTAPLKSSTDVVGIPTLDVTVISAQASTIDPTTQLVLFAKLYDVAADGTTLTLPARLVSPVRVAGPTAANVPTALHISLPGIVHRFAVGHSMRVVLASGDDAYAGNQTSRTASFPTSKVRPGVLTLPVTSAPASAAPPAAGSLNSAAGSGSGSGSSLGSNAGVPAATAPTATSALASTGLPSGIPLTAGALLAVAALVRRRRRA